MEPRSLESRRETQRESAQQLAQELSEVSLEGGMFLPDVNEKMKRLMQSVAELYGNEVELKVGETGTVRFLADELSEVYRGICYSLTYSETVDGREKPEAVAFIDKDGGSVLMYGEGQGKNTAWKPGAGGVGENNPFHRKLLGGWMVDEQYEKDMAIAKDEYNSTIQANRFRELRLTARIASIILSGENVPQQTAPKTANDNVTNTVKGIEDQVGGMVG